MTKWHRKNSGWFLSLSHQLDWFTQWCQWSQIKAVAAKCPLWKPPRQRFFPLAIRIVLRNLRAFKCWAPIWHSEQEPVAFFVLHCQTMTYRHQTEKKISALLMETSWTASAHLITQCIRLLQESRREFPVKSDENKHFQFGPGSVCVREPRKTIFPA